MSMSSITILKTGTADVYRSEAGESREEAKPRAVVLFRVGGETTGSPTQAFALAPSGAVPDFRRPSWLEGQVLAALGLDVGDVRIWSVHIPGEGTPTGSFLPEVRWTGTQTEWPGVPAGEQRTLSSRLGGTNTYTWVDSGVSCGHIPRDVRPGDPQWSLLYRESTRCRGRSHWCRGASFLSQLRPNGWDTVRGDVTEGEDDDRTPESVDSAEATPTEQHRADVAAIGTALLAEAETRGWCEEFDEFVERINQTLAVPLPDRKPKTWEVTATITVTVRVEAETEGEALRKAAAPLVLARQGAERSSVATSATLSPLAGTRATLVTET